MYSYPCNVQPGGVSFVNYGYGNVVGDLITIVEESRLTTVSCEAKKKQQVPFFRQKLFAQVVIFIFFFIFIAHPIRLPVFQKMEK